jgi:uncharacterized protein (UPF0332 family)
LIAARDHIDKARALLDQARYLLAGRFTDGAGRDAYMAGFHAALAFIVQQTGKESKTHSGTRSEFARLARDDHRFDRAFTTFLGRGFGLKMAADYDGGEPLTIAETGEIIGEAAQMVDAISVILVNTNE